MSQLMTFEGGGEEGGSLFLLYQRFWGSEAESEMEAEDQ